MTWTNELMNCKNDNGANDEEGTDGEAATASQTGKQITVPRKVRDDFVDIVVDC